MGTRPYWIRGRYRHDRRRLLAGLDLPPVLAIVDAHRRLRGPYTAAGSLLRAIVPAASRRRPTLVARHHVEILTAAPELHGRLPLGRRAATGPLTAPHDRSRPYPWERTLRIAHGVTDLLRDLRRAEPGTPVTLVVDNVHEADQTDRELLAVLLRRMDPELVTLVVCTSAAPLTEPQPVTESLPAALARHAERIDVPDDDVPLWTDHEDAATAYLDSDGTEDHPRAYAAYLALPPNRRALLHDARAAELATRGERSLRLGAIAYHAEHGTDPRGVGARCLAEAMDHCVDLGFYHAAVELGGRLRAVLDPVEKPQRWWHATATLATAYTELGHPEQAGALYDEARARSQDPTGHRGIAHATALLLARRGAGGARGWFNQTEAFNAVLPAEELPTHHGLALADELDGDPTGAVRRLDEGLTQVRRPTQRVVLLRHRARLHAELGRLDAALADRTAVIDTDPGRPEHHFDRGGLLRRMGRLHEALDDYQQAIDLSPPWAEVHFHRGDTLAELGDAEGALADFDYVLQLEPDHLDARVNRAGLLIRLGNHDEAEVDVETGLTHDPANPQLLCRRGQLLTARGLLDEAYAAYTAAIELAPDLAEAWALRGALHFETGELAAALGDLDHAAQLSGDPTMTFNRATALQASGRFAEAIAAYDAVLALTDDPDARLQRQICRTQLGAASVPRPR